MTTSSQTKIELPLEIVEDILLRIPVKPLHRFRCVSKPWYSLISSPSFHTEHYHRHYLQNPLILVTQYENGSGRIDFSTYNDEGDLLDHFSETVPIADISDTQSFDLIQSCFGLVCLRSFDSPILVCNPSTHQLIALTPPLPEVPFYCIGFGYAPSTQEFKVVRFFYRQHENVGSCEVFTLGTACGWRESSPPPPFEPRFSVPLLHGAVHLMPYEFVELDNHKIAAFDIDTEEYREIPLPEIYFAEAQYLPADCFGLEELRGSLCLSFDYSFTIVEKEMMELWFLIDYNNGKWVKGYNVDLSTVGVASPLAILSGGRILLGNCHKEEGYELGCYQTQEKCFRRNFLKQKMNDFCSARLYVESFLHLGRLEQIGSSAASLADLLLNPSGGMDGRLQNELAFN